MQPYDAVTSGITIYPTYTIEGWIRAIDSLGIGTIFESLGTHTIKFQVNTVATSSRLEVTTGSVDIYNSDIATVPLGFWTLITYTSDYLNPYMAIKVFINGAENAEYYVGTPVSHVSTDSHRIGRDFE